MVRMEEGVARNGMEGVCCIEQRLDAACNDDKATENHRDPMKTTYVAFDWSPCIVSLQFQVDVNGRMTKSSHTRKDENLRPILRIQQYEGFVKQTEFADSPQRKIRTLSVQD